MAAKIIITLFALIAVSTAGIVAPAAYVAPFATSYNAHAVNHAVAAPIAAAPLVAAPAVAAPLAAAPLAHSVGLPYAYSPYAYAPYASQYVLGK